jgi:hypothetical protein
MADADTADLIRRCDNIEAAAQGALKWFREFPARVAAQRPVLDKEFRLAAVEARKLRDATRRPTAVGVYGLSQAGKSYLISTLARPPGRELTAEFDHPRGFLAEINPESEKEATGLVTRFTMRRETGPAGFPVRVRLLNETDIVKILANSWYCDAADNEAAGEVAQATIDEVLAVAEKEAAAAAYPEISEEDIWDLDTYWGEELFRRFVTARAFAPTFWDRVSRVLPKLPLERRIELYALLWNRFEPFTDVMRRLGTRLQQLRFDREAWVPIDALVPKTESVLSVDTLEHLRDPGAKTIEVQGQNGTRCSMTRPELTALIAELQVTMSELPWPIFQETDLLDFPGARERKGMDLAREIEAYPEKLGEFFLRGKVAYLFERYTSERELNALLLCIKESNNPYDATIRQAIKSWISRTHGEKPEDRARVETALFIMLTRMDIHFNRTPGREDNASSGDLWSARVTASLQQPLQEANGWLDNWHPGRAFDNTLLARNPGKSQSLSKLDANGTEISFLPGVPEKIARWGEEFAAHPDVRRYVRDPARAWNEVFRLDDAGMTYLVERLTAVCNPRLKLAQVANQLELRRDAMRRRLAEWHVGDDLEAEHEKRAAALGPALDALERCGDNERFGLLLSQFHLDPGEAREVLLRGGGNPAAAGGAPAQGGSVGGSVSDLRARLRSGGSVNPAPSERRDSQQERAEGLVNAWVAKQRRFAQEAGLRGYFGFDAPAADALVSEMYRAALRTHVVERIASALRKGGRAERFDLAAERHAVAAAQIINEQVNFLGLRIDRILSHDRPTLGSNGPEVFAPPPPATPEMEIEDEPPQYGALFCIGWIEALIDATKRNVYDRGGAGLVNQRENDALGKVLALL